MNASHVAGSGLGALVGAILVALGTRVGLDLTNFDSAALGIAAVGVGLGLGHTIGHAGATVGVFPAIRRFLFGPKLPATVAPRVEAPPAAPEV